MQVIIYKDDEGRIAVVTPAPEFVQQFGIQAVIEKDVPKNKSYKLIDPSEVPEDRTGWVVPELEVEK
jgi:hypothetical protein